MKKDGSKELKRWVEQQAEKFKAENYTTDDIVNLAIACGFERTAVARWQTQKLFKEAI